MDEPLQSFGKYQLVARLAKGGMAQTYRALMTADAGVTKDVVIKKVLPHFAEEGAQHPARPAAHLQMKGR